MVPARKSQRIRAKTQLPVPAPVPVPECHFLRLPAELRNMIYELALVQEEPFFLGRDYEFSKDPPLLSTCKQIRAEASSIYGKNHLRINLCDLDITPVTKWMRLSPPRVALYEGSELFLSHLSFGTGKIRAYDAKKWSNLLTWVDLYRQGRCRRMVELDPKYGLTQRSENTTADVAINVFDMVDELLEKDNDITTAELHRAVSIYRRHMKKF